MTTQAVALIDHDAHEPFTGWTREQVDLIKHTVAKGSTDDEFALFLYTCRKTGLDPIAKQIYAIKRWNAQDQREVISIQTGIDGYRLIAARTGSHAGTDDAVFDTEDAAHPNKATVTTYRFVKGERVGFTASARWPEYCQAKKDGTPTAMWAKMPFLMLAKCAEALALRKAFPAELSGVYTHEEMMQADSEPPRPAAPAQPLRAIAAPAQEKPSGITEPQRKRLYALANKHKVSHNDLKKFLSEVYQLASTSDITSENYDLICAAIEDGSIATYALSPAPAGTDEPEPGSEG